MYLFNYEKEEPEIIVKKTTEIALSNYPKIITKRVHNQNHQIYRVYHTTVLKYVLDAKFVFGREPKNLTSRDWSPDGSASFSYQREVDKFIIVYCFPKINPSFSEFFDLIIRNENFLLDKLTERYLPWITEKIAHEESEKKLRQDPEKLKRRDELEKIRKQKESEKRRKQEDPEKIKRQEERKQEERKKAGELEIRRKQEELKKRRKSMNDKILTSDKSKSPIQLQLKLSTRRNDGGK